MKMQSSRNGMTVTTEPRKVNGCDRWVSTVAKDGVLLQTKAYEKNVAAILGHARLVSLYVDGLN